MAGPHDHPETGSPDSGGELTHHEELVAYLDGELDADATRRIEERLRNDQGLRDDLQRMQRTWDMLSTLPRQDAAPSLTKSTVEMLALEAGDDLARAGIHHQRQRLLTIGIIAAMMFIAGLLGTLLTGYLLPDPDGPLLRDLPVVQQLDSYQQAGNVEFLRLLRERGLFVDDEQDRAKTR